MGDLGQEKLSQSEAAFRSAFVEADLDVAPFQPALQRRLLLYPIDYTMLDPRQLAAIAAAARRQSGMTDAYMTGYVVGATNWTDTYDHRLVDLNDYGDYYPRYRRPDDFRPPPPTAGAALEHLLYPPDGRWGVATSHVEHALVGGSAEFIDDVLRRIPASEDEMLHAFVEGWLEVLEDGRGEADWVPVLLEHVVGAERARDLWP